MELKNVDHIQIKESFVQEGLDYLPEALQKPNIQKILQIDLDRWKLIDDTLYQLAVRRLLSEASGVYLDDIGARFQIYRNGLDDDDYRATLFLKTGEAQKHGTRPDIINVLYQLLGNESVFTYKGDKYRFDIAIGSPCFNLATTADDIAGLMPLITDLRVVDGVGIPFVFDGDDDGGGFGFSDDNDIPTSGGRLMFTSYVSTYDI
ncbi:hypothetical protein [Aeromonas phage 4L372D]|uniref:Uncharacterized protein n=3 Tax=Plateaulakevirus TaxID=2843436 RepID=A0A5B9N3E2_9CAUD|nr:baseplate protein [Aeromonas phage 2L372D]YP_009846416.1 baseplate protein [Aeromonas phage 2L372X]YP_009846652.1 baseplate protein [Aeromonas phage 4L372D]QDB73994.1 hypothetical protein 2L372D_080 [Aeromonas phage 2L372D]QEG08331.1 hypothetical protein [Aeromonas phage 2L372X]QEG08568.1 hypothetical protein [Aeromonas phage 4L372D]